MHIRSFCDAQCCFGCALHKTHTSHCKLPLFLAVLGPSSWRSSGSCLGRPLAVLSLSWASVAFAWVWLRLDWLGLAWVWLGLGLAWLAWLGRHLAWLAWFGLDGG